MILVIKKDLSHQTQFSPAILISWTSTGIFRPLDNNVVATFVSCYMVTKYVLASELVQVATWLS